MLIASLIGLAIGAVSSIATTAINESKKMKEHKSKVRAQEKQATMRRGSHIHSVVYH